MRGGDRRARIISNKACERMGIKVPEFSNVAMQRGVALEGDAYRIIADEALPDKRVSHNSSFFTRDLGGGIVLGGTPDIVGEMVGDIKIPVNKKSYTSQTKKNGTGIPYGYKWQVKAQDILMGVKEGLVAYVYFDRYDEPRGCAIFKLDVTPRDRARIRGAIVRAESDISSEMKKIQERKRRGFFGWIFDIIKQ